MPHWLILLVGVVYLVLGLMLLVIAFRRDGTEPRTRFVDVLRTLWPR